MRAYRAAIQEAERKPNNEERGPDDMRQTANHLVRIAIQALMRMRGVDWGTARRHIKSAAAVVESKKSPFAPE